MKENNNIENILDILLFENGIAIKNEKYINIDFNYNIKIDNKDNFNVSGNKLFRISNNIISIFNINEFLYLIEGYSGIEYISNKLFGCIKPSDSNIETNILIKNKDEEKKIIINTYCSLFELNNFSFFTWDVWNRKCLNSYSISKMSTQWQYILEEGFKIFHPPQVIDDIIFFNAIKGVNKFKKIIGLDIETGQTSWEINTQKPYTQQYIAYTLDRESKLSYGYGGHLFQVFDPLKGELVLEKEMPNDLYVDLNMNFLTDEHLWFSGGKGEEVKFGKIDIQNGEILLLQEMPLEYDYNIQKIVYFKNKLYLLDSNQNLHIYENGE